MRKVPSISGYVFMAVAQWRQMRQMPHFWNGKCNLLKANKIFFFFNICLNSPPLPHFIQTRPTAVLFMRVQSTKTILNKFGYCAVCPSSIYGFWLRFGWLVGLVWWCFFKLFLSVIHVRLSRIKKKYINFALHYIC
jgi:hypothetical protein